MPIENEPSTHIAVVIPCYRVKKHIQQVLNAIEADVWKIYVVDDRCPERTGEFVSSHCSDPRIEVITNKTNLGVGGAVLAGYQKAIEDGADILVKIDGDGQMDPELIPYFTEPIIQGRADYTKGNRFFDPEKVQSMPLIRLFGNAVLSFMTKLSSGYWHLFDPTNGYTAIRANVASHLPFQKISHRYFFETDMLFRLNTLRAVVMDIPMNAVYADETSNLKISKIFGEFLFKHVRNFEKRIFYNYFLRDMSPASFELIIGTVFLLFGTVFGAWHWCLSIRTEVPAPLGTIMLSVLPILTGFQLLLAFLGYDISNTPTSPIHQNLQTIQLPNPPQTDNDKNDC